MTAAGDAVPAVDGVQELLNCPNVRDLAETMLGHEGMVSRVLLEHEPDDGGRCKACPAECGSGRMRWPCIWYVAAVRARATAGGQVDAAMKVMRDRLETAIGGLKSQGVSRV